MDERKKVSHIDYAMVEGTRPAMYRAMKYWGKKPHNIWGDYIDKYCPENGVVLDPFVGSGTAAFEALKLGRKVYAFDLNPLSSFFIEVLTSKFDENQFMKSFEKIVEKVENDEVYLEHYTKEVDGGTTVIYNYKWQDNMVNSVSYKNHKGEAFSEVPDKDDLLKADNMESLDIKYWYPTQPFPNNPSISHKFIKDVGGNSFQHLWTRRNLYILSLMFNEIRNEENNEVRKHLLYGFVQTLHLTSKMVYPRSEKSNRAFSGSWGRADYMIRNKQMEQNPLVVFQRSCTGRQSVVKSLLNAKQTLPQNANLNDIGSTKKLKRTADVNFGTLDVADLTEVVPEKSVDFIITDPPYAGLVQYLDLSLVWLNWLQKVDSKYIPDTNSEITIKKDIVPREEYKLKLTHAFKQMHTVLKDDGYIVITFHHNSIAEWNDFVKAIKHAGFKFDKVIHQYNNRSGESNVSNPYGVSGADFYIRCVKHRDVDFSNDASGFEHFVVEKTIELISKRTEETPFTFIIAGLMPEMLQAGYMNEDDDEEIEKILMKNMGPDKIFIKRENTSNKSGDYWWFNNPKEYIKFPNMKLQDRVDETIHSILRRQVSVKYDDVIADLFRKFPNGLTPDIRNIKDILEKYAYKSSGKWKISETTKKISTVHTDLILQLLIIGKKVKSKTYVGKREQPEYCAEGKKLRDFADFTELNAVIPQYGEPKIDRIQMIDVLWISDSSKKVEAVFEVENSTGFTSAIQRASNLEAHIPKFMIIPQDRETELLRTKDPSFVSSFRENTWRYLTYEDVNRLSKSTSVSLSDIINISNELPS